ncbi:MAG: hypothetical protein ACOY58_07665, partial [Candidatus Micrarchaeota archaeon]
VYGKEGVLSVRESADGVVLVLSQVSPFETRRIIFEKQEVLAHTSKSTYRADGLGSGKAIQKQEIGFGLDKPIPSLSLPEDCGDARIDGASPMRSLDAGAHTLSCERIVDDAYEEAMANLRSLPISATSRIEFDIRITPHIDLDTVPVIIDNPDSSAISKFKVAAVTGGRLKEQSQLSESQYAATIAGLVKDNPAVVRVSYTIDDTPSFVQAQISSLQAANLSQEARSLLEQAAIQAEAGNHSKALDLISQTTSQIKSDEKTGIKLDSKKEELLGKVRYEFEAIDGAISSDMSDSDLANRLSARRDELSSIIREAESMPSEDSVEMLGKVDLKWLEKELTAFKKDAYKSYNDLKQRFFMAGNSTTPAEFLVFEEALKKLGASGRVEHAIEASKALAESERAVLRQEQSKASEASELSSLLDTAESEALSVLEHYLREASAAKGTDYSGFFTISQSKIDKIVKDARAALDKDSYLAQTKIDELAGLKDRMELTLESLREESDAKISILGASIDKSIADEKSKAGFREKLSSIRRLAEAGEYVNALRAGSSLSKELEGGSKPSDSGLLILGLTAMAMLAAAGFYMFKQQKPKELRKLPSLSDPIHGKPETRPISSHPQANR